MKNQFVEYTLAKQLYDLGFNEYCIQEYHLSNLCNNCTGDLNTNEDLDNLYNKGEVITAPTYAQVIEWFDLKYKIRLDIGHNQTGKYMFTIYKFEPTLKDGNVNNIGKWDRYGYPLSYFTRIEANKKGIDEVLKIIKNENLEDIPSKTYLENIKDNENNINHLKFIFSRMTEVHNENENLDYMIKFKSIINKLK